MRTPFFMLKTTAIAVFLCLASSASQAAQPVHIAELFTSIYCPTCPKAHKSMAEIQATKGAQLLHLTYHVNLWDKRMDRADPKATQEGSARHQQYVKTMGNIFISTPQVVINGQEETNATTAEKLYKTITKTPQLHKLINVSQQDGLANVSIAQYKQAQPSTTYLAEYTPSPERGAPQSQPLNLVTNLYALNTGWTGQNARTFTIPAQLLKSGYNYALFIQENPQHKILSAVTFSHK